LTGTNSIIVSFTITTTYSLGVWSVSNCIVYQAITVSVSIGPPVITINTSSSNICFGDSVVITVTGVYTYTYSNAVVFGSYFFPGSTAIYSVIGENGCGITTATAMIIVAPLPVGAIATPTQVCA